ncbi:hypothetical protein SH1V18_06990 [Vallitalea longa]|uniref:Uncharacterized protein n=1 Tax=Vallitalea longa TaxID=2936439 RepID=A0A9W6DF22_9FIRM|nr:hypothetical protein [Vallitalea longa]GKX28219.1 hypothetical protein SH1V18_06990 [Vallitalea longa]
MKKIKKIILITVFSFILINTVAYAANFDLYGSILNSIEAIKDAVLKKDSGLGRNTNDAIKRLDNYIKEYNTDLKSDLESYKQAKSEDAKKVVNSKVDEAIKKLDKEKSKLISDYQKEIDKQIDSELERELDRLQKHYSID